MWAPLSYFVADKHPRTECNSLKSVIEPQHKLFLCQHLAFTLSMLRHTSSKWRIQSCHTSRPLASSSPCRVLVCPRQLAQRSCHSYSSHDSVRAKVPSDRVITAVVLPAVEGSPAYLCGCPGSGRCGCCLTFAPCWPCRSGYRRRAKIKRTSQMRN